MVIGSSIAIDNINTDVMLNNFKLSYYNFGVWSMQMADDYNLLNQYVDKYQPKYVIIPSTMQDFLEERNNTIPKNSNISENYLGYYYIKNFSNLLEIFKRRREIKTDQLDNNRYDCLKFDVGGGTSLNLDDKILAEKKKKDIHVSLTKFPNQNTNEEYKNLENIAGFLKKKGIKLIFIQSPYQTKYVVDAKIKNNVMAHFKKCSDIIKNNGGAYINYNINYPGLPDNFYADALHMTGTGSVAFTKQMAKDLTTIIK